jgi:hypothetical protein
MENIPNYIIEEGAQYIYKNCSERLKKDLSIENVNDILELALDYYVKIGEAYPEDGAASIKPPSCFDEEEFLDYIFYNADEQGIDISEEVIDEILELEEFYLINIGIIEADENEKKNKLTEEEIEVMEILKNIEEENRTRSGEDEEPFS